MKKNNTKECRYCGGKGYTDVIVFYPVSRMKKIMKKHKLSQLSLSKILGISQTAVNNWFNPKTRIQGVKKKYFDILSEKGYE